MERVVLHRYWSNGDSQALFMKHEGYVGALGESERPRERERECVCVCVLRKVGVGAVYEKGGLRV